MHKILRLTSIFDQLLKQPGHAVSVNIAVGELAVFTEDDIQSNWSVLVRDTDFSKTRLKIRRIPAEQQCMVCFEKYNPVNKEISCPHCGSVGAKILAGEEFYLESVEAGNE